MSDNESDEEQQQQQMEEKLCSFGTTRAKYLRRHIRDQHSVRSLSGGVCVAAVLEETVMNTLSPLDLEFFRRLGNNVINREGGGGRSKKEVGAVKEKIRGAEAHGMSAVVIPHDHHDDGLGNDVDLVNVSIEYISVCQELWHLVF
uniref:C2H2-type domain-containing protein n=1 Tax=Globodera pallida TaxID=36090 RepID=A0A183C4U0_GLOPA